MRVRCPAKINLDLRVGRPRADGFHPVRSWFVTVGLYDHVTLGPADDIRLTCDDPAVPVDARNLVWRAAEALRPAGRGVAITLAKQIPAGGGLGGGSSDAAHTLLALNAFWELNFSAARLAEIAASLGSDVPFFLKLPSAVCTGRGEVVTPVRPPKCGWAVLVLPGVALPTPDVFRRFDEMAAPSHFDSIEDWAAKKTPTDALGLLPRLVNDLEPAAFALRPDLARLHGSAQRLFGRPVRMSGSGSTLFTLFDAAMPAIAAAARGEAGLGVPCLTVPLGVYARGIPPDDPPGEGNEADRV